MWPLKPSCASFFDVINQFYVPHYLNITNVISDIQTKVQDTRTLNCVCVCVCVQVDVLKALDLGTIFVLKARDIGTLFGYKDKNQDTGTATGCVCVCACVCVFVPELRTGRAVRAKQFFLRAARAGHDSTAMTIHLNCSSLSRILIIEYLSKWNLVTKELKESKSLLTLVSRNLVPYKDSLIFPTPVSY